MIVGEMSGAGAKTYGPTRDRPWTILAALLSTQSQAAKKASESIILGLYLESRISGDKAAELLGWRVL
jgi:hypothetical protein